MGDRDRFVLSCGHASMLLYSVLHLTGYDLPLQEIKNFRQWGSLTPGHPERGHELEGDGVAKFAASYAAVVAGIEAKAGALAVSGPS